MKPGLDSLPHGFSVDGISPDRTDLEKERKVINDGLECGAGLVNATK